MQHLAHEADLFKSRMQSSKLIYRKDEFYLHLPFEVEDIEPETYLGIDRGIEYVAAWKVIDTQLSSVASGMKVRTLPSTNGQEKKSC